MTKKTQADDWRVVLYHTSQGQRTALARTLRSGRVLAVMMDCPQGQAGVRAARLPAAEERYMRPLDVPLARARRTFRRAYKRLGGTASARRLLRG